MIRQPLTTVTFPHPAARVLDLLPRELPSIGLSFERAEPERGRVWARGLAKAFDMIIWRCWADRFLFEVKARGPSAAQVDVAMVVNLLRYKVRPSEKGQLIDPKAVARWIEGLARR